MAIYGIGDWFETEGRIKQEDGSKISVEYSDNGREQKNIEAINVADRLSAGDLICPNTYSQNGMLLIPLIGIVYQLNKKREEKPEEHMIRGSVTMEVAWLWMGQITPDLVFDDINQRVEKLIFEEKSPYVISLIIGALFNMFEKEKKLSILQQEKKDNKKKK